MKTIETFPDGSTIETDNQTGNRTVFGKMAHDEYFKRLYSEKITKFTDPAIVKVCRDLDGTRKAELIRRRTNAALVATFGEFSYEVWSSDSPDTVIRYASYNKANHAFMAASLHGTNGLASPISTP